MKISASKGCSFMKIDIGEAFLCAKIDENEEVYLHLDKKMSEMTCGCMPELKQWVRWDETLIIRVGKAMYGLIQLPKLWYKELTSFFRVKDLNIPFRQLCHSEKAKDGNDIILI
jgi:hypothetical protein